ncbi:Sec34-like family-domain-containing protein [Sporodiniella umbellata]|nr:Sec34-like family-domain-containing protein [Sporodiniella umbellata]
MSSPAHTPIRSLSTTDILVSTKTATSKPLETLQSFHDWFACLEQEMDQEDVYREHLEKVQGYQDACNAFLEQLKDTRKTLNLIEKQNDYVAEKTSVQADAIVTEQTRLTALADALAARLVSFEQLGPVAKLLNSSRENVCLDKEFIPMLNDLDQSILYMSQHRNYKDSEIYLMRFRQYMTRGMTLIKMYVVSALKSLGQDVYKQLKDPSVSLGKQTTICYVRFKTIAPTIRSLVSQIEKRSEHTEYQSLYDDVLYTWFQTRHYLLSPIITRKLQQLDSPDVLLLCKNVCAYMMSVCTDEFVLYHSLFQQEEQRLYQYLELLTQQFYNCLWSRINREEDTSSLTEIYNLFSMYVMQDNNEYQEEKNHLKFGRLIQNLLKDTQGRLLSRSQ